MYLSDCIDSEVKLSSTNIGFNCSTLDERELMISLANLLYKTKSVRKAITMIDDLSNSEYCIKHSFPPEIVWNNSDLSNEEIINKHTQLPYSGC